MQCNDSLPGMIFCLLENILVVFGDILDTTVLPVSSGQRPWVPLNTLQFTGQPPATKNYLAQNVSTCEVEKAWSSGKADS